jgi:hypothetical protein
MVRTYDWAIHTAIQGLPEVITLPSWTARPGFTTPGIGTGMTLAEAGEQARAVTRADLVEYADGVHDAAMTWLLAQGEEDLSRVPDLEANQAGFEVYRAPGHVQEVHNLFGQPAFVYLLRPSGAHIRRHCGELDVLKQVLRAPV